jgi:hypothetical protein
MVALPTADACLIPSSLQAAKVVKLDIAPFSFQGKMPKTTDAHIFLPASWHLPFFNSLLRTET